MRFFNLDSPLMQGLNKMADLMWLNVLTMICSIPVFTVGASLTAMHYVALKIVRDEECYITKDFMKSFKRNFRQGTIIWLILLFVIFMLAGDFYIMKYSGLQFNNMVRVLIMVVVILLYFTFMFLFPVLAKFDNTVFNTIKNAFFVGVLLLPKTVLMMVLSLMPAIILYLFPQTLPVVFLFGLTAPAWLSAKLYDKFFRKLEEQYQADETPEEEEGEDERIFKDELDESLVDNTNY